MQDELHDGLPEMLSIDNMASGAVYEMINEAIKRVAANVADPNTEPTQKRKLTLKEMQERGMKLMAAAKGGAK